MIKVQVGVIGCGQRLQFLTKILGAEQGVEFSGAWDPNAENAKKLLTSAGSPEGRVYDSYQELVADPKIDWIMVGSPNVFHKEHILAGFAAGKHVFTEKPLATRIEDCVSINEAHERSGKLFATGFVLRYSPLYRKAKEILTSGALGKIVSIDANENIAPDHGAYIMVNWRRHRELSGPHIL
ncbi:MAG: Gfo/Idh/MocA family oxidoreductase, partial [Spirochaetia bacterium]|nr:Gfo/Idh/MocA family oxidoreductase [Spirochaetia bacterium]